MTVLATSRAPRPGMSLVGFSTGARSVMGSGVPVLPVLGLALTGGSSATLASLTDAARVGTAAVLLVTVAALAWPGWLVGDNTTQEGGEGDE